MALRNDMKEPYVTINWSPQDLIDEYGLDEERAMEVMNEIAGDLEDRSIELGWEVIATLIQAHLNDEEE
jgi:hypothetical protein